MQAKGNQIALAIVLLIGPLPALMFMLLHANVGGGALDIVGAFGVAAFILSPHIALAAWVSRRQIFKEERVFVVCIAAAIAIAGHLAVFQTFRAPVVANAQAPLVIVAVTLYQWLAIACLVPVVALYRFARTIWRGEDGGDGLPS